MKFSFIYKIAFLVAPKFSRSRGQQFSSSQVTLSLDEFQEIFSSARLEEAERRLLDQRKMEDAEHKRKLTELENRHQEINVEARRQKEKIFPQNFQVLRHTASGIYNSSSPASGVERDVSTFHFQLTVRVMESRWTLVPMLNTTSVVASDWEIFWMNENGKEGKNDNDVDQSFELVDPVLCPDTLLIQREEQQVMATNRSGLFRISYNSYTRVGKTRNLHTLGMSSLLYPISAFVLSIATEDSTSSIRDFSVQPASAILNVNQTGVGHVDIEATLPLTADRIQIRWLEFMEDSDKKDKASSPQGTRKEGSTDKVTNEEQTKSKGTTAEIPQVTVTHGVFHSIDEGIIVRSLHVLDYATTSELSSLNSVQFVLHGEEGTRVTSVVGHALQSWNAEDITVHNSSEVIAASSSSSSLSPSSSLCSKLVTATFKSSHLDSSVTLQVHTEMDWHQNNDEGIGIDLPVQLPRIECRKVLRQMGHIAVIKGSNMEVHEGQISGVSPCEPSDLPSKLRLNNAVDRPIILSYKYLNPQNSIILKVKEHTAMETLEATVDRFHYKAVVTETHTVHSVILVMQSTKLQYLDLFGLPPSSSMFTVAVNSIQTKPVQGKQRSHGGEESSILVPLLVGLNPETSSSSNKNAGACETMKTSVEVNFVSHHEERIGLNGTLSLAPPRLTLPISVLTVHLRLPKSLVYEFNGDFGKYPMKQMSYPIPGALSYTTGTRVVPKDYEFSGVDDAWPEDMRERHARKTNKDGSLEADGSAGGIKIVTPRTGRSFYFERLLVVGVSLRLNVTYAEPEPVQEDSSWWSRLFGL